MKHGKLAERLAKAVFVASAALLAMLLFSVQARVAGAAEPRHEEFAVTPADRTNWQAAERMRHAAEKRWTAQRTEQLALMREAARAAEEAAAAEDEAAQAGWQQEAARPGGGTDWTSRGYGEWSGTESFKDNPFVYNGTLFTWYPEGTGALAYGEGHTAVKGDDGIYRNQDGRVIVGGGQGHYSPGQVVDTPWGEGVVLDTGYTGADHLDVYTGW